VKHPPVKGAQSSAPCPLCGAAGVRLFSRSGYWICACRQCAHHYTEIGPSTDHVARHYGDDYFFGGGAGFPDYMRDADILRQHGRHYARMLEPHCARGRVLDVGAAAGFVLEGFLEQKWEAVAIEPNQTMARHLHERLGCPVYPQSIETFRAVEPFDLIMMIQVLPHFVDVHAALQSVATATRPGGFWLIETWDRTSATARLFGRHWHEYSPPTVLHWFTPDSLARLAGRYGLQVVDHGRARKRISAAHAKSLLHYRLEQTQARPLLGVVDLLPDHWSVPYPGDDLFWLLLQHRTGAA
jgi:SAM-dependent methyltransferase